MKKIILSLLVCWAALQTGAAEELKWLTDLPKAQEQAKKEKKLVLVDFTGSDWCGWCIKLDKETFAKPEFAEYAKKNLVLVQLDFPQKKTQPAELKKTNHELEKKYDVKGFPTLIALNADGKQVWTQTGYLAGGPKALIAELDAAKKK